MPYRRTNLHAAALLATALSAGLATARPTSDFFCFPPNMTQAEFDAAMDQFGLRPPSAPTDPAAQRFVHDTVVWTGAASFGSAGLAARADLTFSFAADGVQWGLASIHAPSVGPCDLNAELIATFGDLDRGREHIRQALAAWSRHTGVNYFEVHDDGSPMDDSTGHLSTRGDIRIGGADATGAPFLAYNAFPSGFGAATVGGGDMFIATNRFTILGFKDPSDNYRLLRNTVAHEHGHGLGAMHVVPCTQTKVMEPQVPTGFDMLAEDDIRGGQRNYGDHNAGNHLFSDAIDFGDLAPVAGPLRSIADATLSLNGDFGPNGTHTDWFRFQLGTSQPLSIFATPIGSVYDSGAQTFGCSGATASFNAKDAGNILLELTDINNGNTWISNNLGPGGNEIIATGVVPAGDYSLRVTDAGPTAHQDVQRYELVIQPGAVGLAPPPPPTANTGVVKIAFANQPCWFIGRMNSVVNAPGATIVGYDWDVDSDGIPDIGSPTGEVPFIYPSSGVYSVTLWITDSNGQVDDHSIIVTIVGGLTQIIGVNPGSAYRGQAVTGIIDGANFFLPTTFALSGVGWSATSLTAIDTLGTQAEVTIQVDPNATPGFRDVRVTNTEGSPTLINGFEILLCTGDANADGVVDTADLGALIIAFGSNVTPWSGGDFNGDGVIDTADLGLLITNFGNVCF
jgi:hypothetical protein